MEREIKYTQFNDLMASVPRDVSTSANIISGFFSRHSNVIFGKAKGHEAKQDRTLPNLKRTTTEE